MFKKALFLLCAIGATIQLSAQVIGSRENSDQSPTSVSPSELSGGGFTGDVNVFNGSYSASYPLGSVSTPGGLSYGINLGYSASYSAGQTPSVCSGIPYGEGWSLNTPVITVSNAAYFSFLNTYECVKKRQSVKDLENYFKDATTDINGIDHNAAEANGDVFWFSPRINIPGVASGRAIFKYIDEDDASCAVFVLNKFESYIEARFYGDRWTVLDPTGNLYEFRTTLLTYRSPNNARTTNYNGINNDSDNELDLINNNNAYGDFAGEILNTLEPKQAFTSWYCDLIRNRNIPNQHILFQYEKFGGFNYFKEFEQPLIEAKIAEKLRENLTLDFPSFDYLDYTSYTDVLLTKLSSFNDNSVFEILDLGYQNSTLVGSRMLDPNDPGVQQLDSLYAYTTVYSEGSGADQFENWNRYYHGKSQGTYDQLGLEPNISNNNPYLTSDNGSGLDGYVRDDVSNTESIAFEHAFLESPRVLTDGSTLIPGDIYEIRTKISDNNGLSSAMGTGTIDINVVTGDLGFELGYSFYADTDTTAGALCDSLVTISPSSHTSYSSLNNTTGAGIYLTTDYEKTRSTPIFTTQNQAVKWHLNDNATSVNTSNFFVMPNIPEAYDGMNIQIGPGNSDTEHSLTSLIDDIKINEDGTIHPSAYRGYSHIEESSNALASYEDISQNFGIGMPWANVAPLYVDQMGGVDADNVAETNAYDFWWNDQFGTQPWPNEPTKFNENVRLQEVEVVRYSKTPYMLTSVKQYRVNGEVSPLDDTSGFVLIAQNDFEYSYDSKRFIENYPYQINDGEIIGITFDSTGIIPQEQDLCPIQYSDTLIHSNYRQYVYTLNKIKNIPVRSWEKQPEVAATYSDSALLQTEFEYQWYGYEDDEALSYEDFANLGRRSLILSKYIDQLGGETSVEYYPRDSKFTLKEGRYTGQQRCAAINTQPIFGQSTVFDIHPAVHFLTKLDENNNVETLIPSQPLKRWEYVYDTSQIIFQSFDYNLSKHFRQGYTKSYSKGFAKTTVYEPKLETGEQSYTEYEHHGNIYEPSLIEVGGTTSLDPDLSTIEEYLFFGKPKRITRYNYLNQKEEETLFDYGYTKAHENGFERNIMVRDNLASVTDYDGLTNYVHAREYEYGDYYRNEEETYEGQIGYTLRLFDYDSTTTATYSVGGETVTEGVTIIAYMNLAGEITSVEIPGYESIIPSWQLRRYGLSGTLTGETVKPVLSLGGYISQTWGDPIEKAGFLETYFYNDLKIGNPDYFFHSYFLNTF